MENRAVRLFREYLRIPTVHPNVDYSDCVKFLKSLAEEIGLDCRIYGTTNKPVVIMTWPGTEKNAGSILLNSHMDVVPVVRENWTYEPFDAVKLENGDIYGRGAQDIKCLGMQYVEAVRLLIEENFKPKRTVHISFVPDEEIGGLLGMKIFAETQEFKNLNIKFAIDEGGPSPVEEFLIFNDERCGLPVKFTCHGTPGHGSLPHINTAGEKVRKILDEMMDFRENQFLDFRDFTNVKKLAEVTTVNLTRMEGGALNNVVPSEISMTFDIRLSINIDHEQFKKWIEEICEKAGGNVDVEYFENNPKLPRTATDETNPFWVTFSNVLRKMNFKYEVCGCPGATDARYLRKQGIPVLGFSCINRTPVLLHGDNERLNEKIFLQGVAIFKNMVKELVNV